MDGLTPADVKVRFPGFAAAADATVQAALDEAALLAGTDWTSAPDARLGRLLLTAHILTLDGQGSSAEPPPETSATTRSSAVRPETVASSARAAASPAASGTGWAASRTAMPCGSRIARISARWALSSSATRTVRRAPA